MIFEHKRWQKILFSSENSFNFIVDNNKIIIYEILENQIKETYIFPYEILRTDNLICTYFNLDLETLSNIEVVSYLEKINISVFFNTYYIWWYSIRFTTKRT